MAELFVLGEYQGPGERETAETLARDLPQHWCVLAGRKLSGPDRSDLDLVVVGERAIFLLEEKHWGPRIELGDQVWRVRGEERRNPLDRVNHLARVLAGQLRGHVPGYRTAIGGRRIVVAGIVLSYEGVELAPTSDFIDGDAVKRLSDVSTWLRLRDAEYGADLGGVREAVLRFLTGLPARGSLPERIGPYRIVQEIEPIETARCFHAKDGARTVILRCYPMHGWGPDLPPSGVVERERLALDRLEERDRTWQIHPAFADEVRQWTVVPVVPAKGKNLMTSLRIADPERTGNRLPRQVAADVVADAFRALGEVHEAGLVHRGLYPRRIYLGRGLRVKFSDFYLARASGERTITPEMNADADPGTPYRAPECRVNLAMAGPCSDVYSLALALSCWVLGDLPAEPDVRAVRKAITAEPMIGDVLASCLDDDPGRRPSAEEAAERISETHTAGDPPTPVPGIETFQVGGIVDDRYELRQLLGQGGFAQTWRVWDRMALAERVIKRFHNDDLAEHALREFQAADVIRHDNCARVYDISREAPRYLVLEYFPGVDLRYFSAHHAPDADRYRSIALDLLSALDHLHSRGILHRDITPKNVIVTPDHRGKLIDFGVAGRPRTTTVVGTPPYSAPEQSAGMGATARSDLYGFAVTMIYTMLRRYPYGGDPVSGEARRERLVPLTEDERRTWGALGAAMLDTLFTAASADPAERPGSAEELAFRLSLLGEMSETGGAREINPTVDDLRGLYRASTVGNGGNRGLDDDFSRDTYVPTLLDEKLLPAIVRGDPRWVLLTGNPGDGKTAFLVKVGETLRALGAEIVSEDAPGWRMLLDGHVFIAVFDASESHDGKSSDELMREALLPAPGEQPDKRTALLAVNDGRLLHFLEAYDDEFDEEAMAVRRQLEGRQRRDDPSDDRIIVVDLKRRTLARRPGGASLVSEILGRLTAAERWAVCDGCLSRAVCPIRHNAEELRGRAVDGVEELVATSHLRRQRRATFRDVRSALSWLITGDRSCADVHEARENGMDLRLAANAQVEDLAFDPRSADYLIQEWAGLDPADTAAPDVERAARGLLAEPANFTEDARIRAQRRLFIGTWRPDGLDRAAVRVYRYLHEFEETLLESSDDPPANAKARLLLGLSRLLGAPGYQGCDLALADQGAEVTWAVLKEIPAAEFTLQKVESPSEYVEWRPEALQLVHAGASLTLTLDTFELVMRAADGDLIGDSTADSVRQEIETFAAVLRRSPATAVRIVNPAGVARRAVITDRRIVLEAP
ncbi:protein kinase domain-containing protein [Actinocorallia lasiicapitis]